MNSAGPPPDDVSFPHTSPPGLATGTHGLALVGAAALAVGDVAAADAVAVVAVAAAAESSQSSVLLLFL